MLPIQIILVAFALFALFATIKQYRRSKIETPSFFLLSFVWICTIVVGLWPHLITRLAEILGIQRGVDLLIYSSIIVLFIIILNIYTKLEKLDQDIGKIVTEIAILHPKEPKSKKGVYK